MNILDTIRLTDLARQLRGRRGVRVAIIDGPVKLDHPDLAEAMVREIGDGVSAACASASDLACRHGTFVAGVLCGRRGSVAPAICPDCTILARPIFTEAVDGRGLAPSAMSGELARAIADAVDAGAHVINVSARLAYASDSGRRALQNALAHAAAKGSIVVAAGGDEAALAGSTVTSHPWVIPVVACRPDGQPIAAANFGNAIGRRGFRAPGLQVTSLGTTGSSQTFSGSSAAAPFVSGAIALLFAKYPGLDGAALKESLQVAHARGRPTVVPPLFDAAAVDQTIAGRGRRTMAVAR